MIPVTTSTNSTNPDAPRNCNTHQSRSSFIQSLMMMHCFWKHLQRFTSKTLSFCQVWFCVCDCVSLCVCVCVWSVCVCVCMRAWSVCVFGLV